VEVIVSTTSYTAFGGNMSTEVILALIIAVTVIFVVILWQGMNVAKTQMASDQKMDYQKLAEQATFAEQKAADSQQKIAESLEQISARLAAIEKLLSEVQ
jgi:predicted negative regulator of RcsB-dependent stress response